MLHVPVGANSYGTTLPSWGTTRPATANGTLFPCGSATFGAWTQLGADLTADAYGILINVNSNFITGAGRATVANIGVDESGGTTYVTKIANLLIGSANNYLICGVWYFFPIFIPAPSAIAIQSYTSMASGTSARAGIILMQQPPNPAMIRKGSFVETLGVTGYDGTAITPGSTAESAWVAVGTTTQRCWWWQVGFQCTHNDTAVNAGAIHVDIANSNTASVTGTGIIIRDLPVQTTTTEAFSNMPLTAGCEFDVPAGTTMYARAQTSGTAEAQQVAIYGMGG